VKKLMADGQRLVNEDGAQVILNGINLVCKDKSKGYVYPCDESLFAWFQGQGFNVIRLGLIWDGVEPEPGVYDDRYLARIKQQADWAARHGIYVFLDMHQDLYSLLYGDGAPPWATITDGLPHVEGPMWSDAYLISPAVGRALDHFWRNSAASDGIGLQDHYASMWQHISQFFSDCPNLIGYDIMNEPYPGSGGEEVFGAIIAAYAQRVLGLAEADAESLAGLWFDEEKKQEVLAGMADMEVYGMLAESAQSASQAFEREVLSPFYDKMGTAIRRADSDRFLMLETSYFANMGIESGVELARDTATGSADRRQVYAPHGYDLVVDTEHYEIYNQDRVDLIFAAHRRVQERLQVPVLVGEWGAFTDHPATFELTKEILAIFEQYLWSNTYWCWVDGHRQTPYAAALNRAYPQATGGKLVEYRYEREKGIFRMVYEPAGHEESWIYHPHAARLAAEMVDIDGTSACQIEIRPLPDAEGGIVAIRAPQSSGPVIVTIRG